MSPQRNAAFPDVPTLKETLGTDWTLAAWRGIAAPKGLPKEAVDRLVPALKKAWESKEFKDFMNQRGFGMVWGDPGQFAKHMAEDDAKMGKVMKALGIAKG
jgi:tripartite-type tricarboxylate transporter receptor subunit TctC